MKRKGQGTIEFAVLIGVIAAALVLTQVYMKRAISGKLRLQAEQVSGGSFYSPRATFSDYDITKTITEDSYSDKFRQTSHSVANQVTDSVEQVSSFSAEPQR
ncbi:MAG: hypothetical protein PHT41_02535 [Candidatus Omnitrophica bacterium]|nr:hypothetical protein [Candidatus Omnitrophota bacterium]MDD5238013.1 hypothetical protein [Candidatus Omnitrophota bacterium]